MVEARLTAIEIQELNTVAVTLALMKLISDSFIYFHQETSKELMALIVEELKSHCRRMSPVEITKAIEAGRKNQDKLYGKLNANNFISWIRDYEGDAGDKIAEYHRNEKYKVQKEMELVEFPDEVKNKFQYIGSEKKREFTHEEKLIALKDRMEALSDEEQALRVYGRAWKLEDHGDYQKYMKNFRFEKT